MNQQNVIEIISSIKKTQENIAVTLGVTLGTILVIYFFSMSELLNRGLHFLVQMQIVTAILIVIALVFIRKIAFFITRKLKSGKPGYQQIFSAITFKDLTEEPAALAEKIKL